MKITVAYLGGSRAQTGCKTEVIEVPDQATVAVAKTLIAERHTQLAPHLATIRWARNFEFADLGTTLEEGDELGLLPPVQGGAPRKRAELVTEPIDPRDLLDTVGGPDSGATVIFVGTVRDHSRGKSVAGLNYETYGPMAEKQLAQIAEHCEQSHPPATRVAIAHRHGQLRVGDISVAIAAASPHREEAFGACRQALESIKDDVAIWKQETTTDGEEWVGWGGG